MYSAFSHKDPPCMLIQIQLCVCVCARVCVCVCVHVCVGCACVYVYFNICIGTQNGMELIGASLYFNYIPSSLTDLFSTFPALLMATSW